MILDTHLFESTSRGSARRIRCRCDACGKETSITKQKLVQRGDQFEQCRDCYYERSAVKSKALVDVACVDCGAHWMKRQDSLTGWSGLCRSCRSKRLAALPGAKERMRENGIRVMKRVGKLPHYPDRNYRRGPANNKWRGGITPENQKIRLSPAMREWSRSVLQRDNFTCQLCGKHGGNLHADHIKPFALFADLRFEMANGRALCAPCHAKYGSKVVDGVLVREAVMSLKDRVNHG